MSVSRKRDYEDVSQSMESAESGPNESGSQLASSVATPVSESIEIIEIPSSSEKKPIKNPYSKKFVGGAENARLQARKKARKAPTRILTPLERVAQERDKQRLLGKIPPNMNTIERFGAALLRTSPADLVASESESPQHAMEVWSQICKRVDLTVPTGPLLPMYDDPRIHHLTRAALVLEESRTALAQPLVSRWGKDRKGGGGEYGQDNSFVVTAHNSDASGSTGHMRVTFRKNTQFSKEELFHIRPGTVFQCMKRDSARKLSDVILGMVLSANREIVERNSEFNILWFRDIPKRVDDVEYTVTPIQTLISELRCFEAMTSNNWPPFLNQLLGHKPSTHLEFDEDGNAQIKSKDTPDKLATIDDFFLTKDPDASTMSEYFHLPLLNDTQNKAADTFLESSKGTITLIQGPPGTGKTTLLVSIICRYLLKENKNPGYQKRLLVCAPTNKAVSVIASRLMAAMDQDKSPFNAIMVGDADKLLAEERDNKENLDDTTASLKSIFLFSWWQNVIDEYRSIRNFFIPNNNMRYGNTSELLKVARRLEKKLKSNLTGLPPEILRGVEQVHSAMKTIHAGGGADVVSYVNTLLKQLEDVQKNQLDFVWQELIGNAHILFCTLASAGGMLLKNHRVDDLIVDEAAAATEPELYIPFHMQPNRLLCVGDPSQLPATVLSRKAMGLGLSISLHERLMFQCNHEFIMLDVQYRMNPAISAFPSQQFYGSKLKNGANVLSPKYVGTVLLLDGAPFTFISIKGREEYGPGGSYRNHAEAQRVVDLILDLRSAASGHDPQWHSASKVRVITFYQAQVALLKQLLYNKGLAGKVVVATVDSSQGCEADIVLVSFVRSSTATAGFLADNRRMNVALTRAKHQLICVGNVEGLCCMVGGGTLRDLAQNAMERKVVQNSPVEGSGSGGNNQRNIGKQAFVRCSKDRQQDRGNYQKHDSGNRYNNRKLGVGNGMTKKNQKAAAKYEHNNPNTKVEVDQRLGDFYGN